MAIKEKKIIVRELLKNESFVAVQSPIDQEFKIDVFMEYLDTLNVYPGEFLKILENLKSENVIQSYSPQLYWNDDLGKRQITQVWIYLTKGQIELLQMKPATDKQITFDEDAGILTFRNKQVRFTKNKNPYLFIKLLGSKFDHVFPYNEIKKYFEAQNIKLMTEDIKQLARQVRNKLKTSKIPTKILFSNKGYSLKSR